MDDMNNLDFKDINVEKIQCPVCDSPNAVIITKIIETPYTTDFALTSVICKSCGFRSTDFLNLTEHDPLLLEYRVKEEKDLYTKIIRSTSATVEIPELGIKVEPGRFPQPWVKNIESILLDFQGRVEFLLPDLQGKKQQDALVLLEKIEAFKQAKQEFTVKVRDPKGNSQILPYNTDQLFIKSLKSE